MEDLVYQIKSLVLVLVNFFLSLHCNADNSYLFVNENEIFNFKADNKNVNFPTQFCLWSVSNGFKAIESREVSLKRNVYDFSGRLHFYW